MKAKLFLIYIFGFISLQISAQELLPFVENYSKSNYQGDNQIWSAVQGNDNAMYFANNNYLLRYDGVKWEKYKLPNKTIIRSIMVEGNKIYSGSYQEFGYWYRKDAKMHYVSISKGKKVFDEKNNNDEIWKIFKFNGKIYFQSFNGLFIYDGKVIKEKKIPFLISYCFVVGNELLIASVEKGIYRLINGEIKKVNGLSLLENNVIHSIQKYQAKTYFFTKKHGVYVFENNVLSPWKNDLNEILKSANINAAQFIKKNKLIIGTANNGVYILDLTDGTYKNINRNNVLMNNSILSIGQDKENDLWLGLDNGIAHIEVNSPISIFYDNSGILGSVYSVASTPEGYLMASNHGVFKYENKHLSLIPGTQGQAWVISKINDQYLIGHNEGTFIYKNGLFSRLSDINGGWNLAKSGINNSYLQATYSGVVVYNDANNLKEKQAVKGLLKPIKYLAQNRKNEIWAADINRGLYRILYNDAYETKPDNVTQRSKISNDFGVKIFEFRNEILFLINNSWYTFNSITNQLEANQLFNDNFKNVSNIVSIDENHFMVLQDGLLYHIYAKGSKFVRNSIQEKYYKGKIINDNLKIFKDKNNYLLNLDDGFISLDLKDNTNENADVKIEAFNNGILVENNSKIRHNSELRIDVISGVYGASKPDLFYRLNGTKEYVPIKEGLILLNNLNSGSHEVTVYNNDGLHYNKAADFQFSVANAWYYSFWMICVYLIVAGLILYLYYKWNKMKYIQKLKLQKEELKHQREILEMELKAENELNRQEYEKHILELELQSKSSEVAGKSLSIAKQSEMIENIQNILDSESDFNKLKSEIKKAIKINAVNKHEWETFETNLNQINNEFIINLSKKYPNLTSKDIKLCVYLKMNLSSKEIAPMMNISFRGVELHRYRLRKKLELNQDEVLSKFLLSI
ncbi:helix-turn-helix and ligand-binding sensor domain-containing protein [Flavobacterium marginilacus]|uniref:helix-turn-helix and ligand-binding sensor domain-containing protein n=1 Tax=Flavobacterium marginilacus TaxID=3003256 RepID=UPI00248DAA5C|nr:histidine kinase [Flavobacterium marginilacus]